MVRRWLEWQIWWSRLATSKIFLFNSKLVVNIFCLCLVTMIALMWSGERKCSRYQDLSPLKIPQWVGDWTCITGCIQKEVLVTQIISTADKVIITLQVGLCTWLMAGSST